MAVDNAQARLERWQRTGLGRLWLIVGRHGLLMVPLVAGTFGIVSGAVGNALGLHNLFFDHRGEFDDFRSAWVAALPLTRFQVSGFATALMGLLWSVFILICDWEATPRRTHPIKRVSGVLWPGVVSLSLIQLVAGQLRLGAGLPELGFGARLLDVAFGIAGSLTGLGLVAAVLAVSVRLAAWSRVPQIVVVALSTAVVLMISTTFLWQLPGSAIFVALAWLVLAYTAIELTPVRRRFFYILGVVALLLIGALPQFKLEWPGLERQYAAARLGLASASDASAGAASTSRLVDPIAALDAWRDYAAARRGPGAGKKPKFVAVAISGGAYRAAFWGAHVLDRLEQEELGGGLDGLTDSVRLFTGASGGMIAAAYHVARGEARDPVQKRLENDLAAPIMAGDVRSYFQSAKRDSLTPVVQTLVQCDFWSPFWPLPWRLWPCTRDGELVSGRPLDRGLALEREWMRLQDLTFEMLRHDAAAGTRPLVILSPVLVPSGRPLLISPLDLGEMTADGLQAVELFKRFPDALASFELRTAVRMSATFPYISPAIDLPFSPPERVVDAAFADGSGITVATAFLTNPRVAAWLAANTSGVVLVQINAFGSDQATRDCAPEAAPEPNWLGRWAQRVGHGLTSPIEGVAAARGTSNAFAIRQQLRLLAHVLGRDRFAHVEFSSPSNPGYNWHMPDYELVKLVGDFDRCNAEALKRLRTAWARGE